MSLLTTGYWLLATIPLAFLALFFFYPLLAILQVSFMPDGVWTWEGVARVAETPYFARVLGFTVAQAAASTLLTLLLGLPIAYLFARWEFRGQAFMRAVTTLPFLLPTIVVAFAFSALLGPRGWLNLTLMQWLALEKPPIQILDTVGAILIAHVFYNLSIVIRIVGNFWTNLDPQLTAAAQLLGANRWRAFTQITLPLLMPAIIAASLLIFIFDFTSFGVVLLLGGPRLATLEVEIYRQTVNLFDLPVAATLSLIQLIVTFALMAFYTHLQARLARPLRLRPQRITRRRPRHGRERALIALLLGALVLFIGAPLITLIIQSLWTPDGLSLSYYTELFVNRRQSISYVPPIEAVGNSLLFALMALLLALPLGACAAYALLRVRWLDPVFMLPLATSAVTLGFGFIIALDQPPLNLRATVWLVPIAHTLIAMPFVVRALLPVLRSLKPSLREAASVLGASPAQVWRAIDAPLIMRALVVGAIFTFTVSLGEFGATALVARPEMPTLPLAIYRLLGQPGLINSGQALALSTILMVVSVAAMASLERLRWEGMGEF
jgi:thiamine transport system permease protein